MSDSSLPELSSEDQLRIEQGIRELHTPRRKLASAIRYEPVSEEPVKSPPPVEEKPQQPTKQPSILNGVTIDKQGLSEQEYQKLETIKESTPSVNDLRKMNVNSLMEETKLTNEDRKFIVEEMNQSKQKDDPFHRLERILTQDDSIIPLLDKWTSDVEAALGKKVNNPTELTQEEIKKIPPIPEKLQDVMKFMFSGSN